MASDVPGLRAENVTFAFDNRPVVREVSLALRPGEALAVAGPNGSGKTTLLSLMTGARRPDSGTVRLDGEAVEQMPPRERARRIAVVSQYVDPQLMFRVETVVGMGRTPYAGLLSAGSSGDRVAVRRAMDVTETQQLSGRPFSELSGGEQQRVMLAMALAQETDFLLLDEPTVHLDLHHQHHLLELLLALRGTRNIGILAVMHDLNLAALYFDRLALMQDGRVVADAPATEILADPRNLDIFGAPLTAVTHPQAGVPQVLLRRESARDPSQLR